MKTDLHNLLDQPLVGEPTLRTPHEHLQRSRSMLRSRRLLRSGLAAGSAAAVIAITLSSGSLGSASAGKDAGDRDLVATQPPATPSGSVITTEVRERYPSQARIVDCLVAKGYNVTLGRDGGIGYEIATSGIDSYYAAEDVCTKAVEGDQPPRSLDQLTQREWRSLYHQERTTAACLRQHDIDVPALPPFRSYVTRYGSKHQWYSYDFIPKSTGTARWKKLDWDCPQPRVDS